ncbi:hypothetical protein E4H04_06155 [Candidatus Bathyarchaeota archaeon]|nr:MAG: hypothetical protein E4H04_06155 [Candidatus Bathyarchaeota archaeon]
MSNDIIGWYSLKKIDLRKKMDQQLAIKESMEAGLQEIKDKLKPMEEGFSKNLIITSLESIYDLIELQRVQVIWINALKEGLMEIEQRLDNL